MDVAAAVGAWVLGKFYSNYYHVAPNVTAELGPRLSSAAQVYFPETPQFEVATDRWSLYGTPNFTVVVEVALEEDVVETVKYANEKDIPFLAVSGGHGSISSLDDLQHGIQIWMNKLDSITISDGGDTATFGGGVRSKKIIDILWDAGKQTVTGGCECTSLLGPGLGGGHGFMQGRYGLISDQFISMRLVTADGAIQTMSASSHPDLWWAMQGAGHNFGIVTSVTSKIYDIRDGGIWSYESYIFTHDKVEGIYDQINQLSGEDGPPVDLINFSVFLRIPDIDPEKPVIMLFLLQEDASSVDEAYTAPFRDLGAVMVESGSGTYKDIPTWTGLSVDSPPCKDHGIGYARFPVNLQSYNIQAQRAVFDAFAKGTSETPQFNGSLFLLEGYSLQGVKAVDPALSAFPHRADNLLVAPQISYSDIALKGKAVELGESLRQILFEASDEEELHAYVNYAAGNEQPKNWYGHEEWRLEKLRTLKEKYDPKRRFSFYAPVN